MNTRELKFLTVAAVVAVSLGLAGCGGGGTTAPPEPPEPTPYERAVDEIAAATTAAAAQAAYDAVKGDVTAAEGDRLQAAVDARIAALAMMDRAAAQKMAIMTAVGNIDTSDLSTQAAIDAAETAIAALKAALAAATDVSDADKAMYQGQVTAAETAVASAQSALDHAAQTTVLTNAVTALQGIDLSDLSTQEKIDAAQAAVDTLRAALAAATELSAAEKTAAMTELATASRTVMAAQGSLDIEGQKMALATAVDDLDAIDLDALMTQAQIDAAEAAIIALDMALAAATDLTDAEKLDATVDVTLAKRKVMDAKETLASNIGDQREALKTAGMALGELDLDDLDTAEKIAAANEAVEALKMALAAATHLSDADKAMYQTQLDTATETVRTAQTGMDRGERKMAQRTAIMKAVTMARTAVNGVTNMSTDSEVSAADQAITDLEAAIAGAADLPEGDTDVAMAEGTLATLKAQLATAKTARTAYLADKDKADKAAMTKLGKALHAALAGNATADTTALDNIEDFTTTTGLQTAGLVIDAAAGAGALPDAINPPGATLKAVEGSASALGSWNGMDYLHTMGTGADKYNANGARVYTNKGPGKRVSFTKAYTLVSGQTGATAGDNGYLGSNGTTVLDVSVGAADLAKVKADLFTHSGTQTHAVPDRSNALYVRGTYDGAPGEFRCTTGCSSTNNGSGAPSALGGTWHFKPDTGAMVHQPDDTYLYYGWWVSKAKDGGPTAASAFTGIVQPTDTPLAAAIAGSTLTGSATYEGHAAGKYAINNVLDGTGHGGHFAADAELMATFGSGATAGMTGTIDNFRLNDGSEDPGWSVSLALGAWAADGAITAPTDAPTVWSINGNKAPASGTWSGQMYDEMPGNAPDGDGSNIPTTVTGTFYSEFSTIGRMVGAFGADKQ